MLINVFIPTTELKIIHFNQPPCLHRALVYIPEKRYKISNIVHKFTLKPFMDEQMDMIRHQTVSIKDLVSSREGTIRLIRLSHHVQGFEKLVITFLILKDVLMINTTHHHVINPRS